MKSRWQEYKEKNGVTPLDLLNPKTKKTTDDIASSRLAVCLECPELIHMTKQCKKCGCFMTVKTTIEAAQCPLEKW